MWTPSNASGAVPLTTMSMSARVSPAESRAILVASKHISLPVSWRRRRNRVIPAPITPTFLIGRPPGRRPLPSRTECTATIARGRGARRLRPVARLEGRRIARPSDAADPYRIRVTSLRGRLGREDEHDAAVGGGRDVERPQRGEAFRGGEDLRGIDVRGIGRERIPK